MGVGSIKVDKAPCYRCKDRWVNETGRCHSTCEKYIAFATEVKSKNHQVNEERSRERRNMVREGKTASQIKRIEKARKR